MVGLHSVLADCAIIALTRRAGDMGSSAVRGHVVVLDVVEVEVGRVQFAAQQEAALRARQAGRLPLPMPAG